MVISWEHPSYKELRKGIVNSIVEYFEEIGLYKNILWKNIL